MKISNIAVHHSGGLGNDKFVSTAHLTLADINNAHKWRWPDFKSEMGYWVGYNVMIFPDGKWIQTRLLGEETAAQLGHNQDTFSICLIGNFTKFVDDVTEKQTNTLKEMLYALATGRAEQFGIKIKPGTEVALSWQRIYPHRFFGQTECYGNGIPDNWARGLVEPKIREEISAISMAIQKLWVMLQDLIKEQEFKKNSLGDISGFSCNEMV